jgi:glycosyltransferase involved in cell wall biosynthesis
VCLTEGEAKSYSELLGSDKYITSIPECVNVPESMPDSNLLKYVKNRFRILEKEHVLLSVGRIHPTKRLELCINAFKLVSENFGNVKLIVVGPQDNEDYIVKLKRDVRKLNLEKKVIFTGKVSMEERDCLYSLASLVMHTSEYEAFCRPALEAWRYKTPIVAFNLGPATDFIEKDRGGYVTKRWGDIVEMSQLVTKVLGRREFTALGNNGYDAVIKKYSKERIAEQYSKVYEKVLETRMSP